MSSKSVNKKLNPLYDERFNYYFASETNLGGPIVRIIKPDKTPEENEREKQAFQDHIEQILERNHGVSLDTNFVSISDVDPNTPHVELWTLEVIPIVAA